MTTIISPKKLRLELGTIIQINAPTNPILNEHIFLIHYLDTHKIVLIDDSSDTKELKIDDDGNLTDESIKAIAILSKPIEKGYARQNGLVTNIWIDIYFGGDIPTTITGKITNLEEDMIEITTYPEKDVIYIDFGYKGLPENIPIEKIDIREAPASIQELATIDEIDVEDDIVDEHDITYDERGDEIPIQRSKILSALHIKSKIQDILAEADNIVWGDVVGTITQEVEVQEYEKRYDIETQANDILNELLSTIPNIERTTNVLNNIHRIINRFIQLRKQFSTFNDRGQISGVLTKGSDYKPLVEKLYNLNSNLYWILPVVKNKRKIYDPTDIDDVADVEKVTMTETRINEGRIENQYYSNQIPGEQNKYKYLIRNLNPYFTPFTSPDNMEEGILHKQNVNKNIMVLIDNFQVDLEDLYSSVSSCSQVPRHIQESLYERMLHERRFVILKYNLGINMYKTNYQKINNLNNTTTIEPITNSDSAYIKSFVLLPEPFVRFSHINLPNTTIYEKSNLNQTSIAYWKLLNNKTSITTDTITNLNKEHIYQPDEFLQDIRQVVVSDDLITDEPYRKFLQTFIPKTRVLFELVKKYIQNKTNYVSILSYLEPFLIYKEDISFMQYKTIIDYINTNINKLHAHLEANKASTNILRNWKIMWWRSTIRIRGFTESILLSMLSSDKDVIRKYGISQDALPSEVYAQIITTDYGNLYNSTISLLDSSLYSDFNIVDTLSDKIDMLKIEMSADKKDTECGTLILAKKYIEIDEITEDNGKDIFFDKKYDTTRYDIIHEYKTKQDNMSAEEFKEFLKRELQLNIGLTEDKAEIDAIAMIQGQRPITDGVYAVLETYEDGNETKFYYYKRTNGTWVLDEHITEQIHTTDTNFFCNSRKKCLYLNKKCESTKEAKTRIDSSMTQDIIKNIMDEHILNKQEMMEEITKQQKIYLKLIEQIKHLIVEETLQYNKKKYDIGLGAEHAEIDRSPHIHLRNLITGEQDLVKRMSNLRRFIMQFTREPNSNGDVIEDEHWLYCIQTNTKLLPSFYKQLSGSTLQMYSTTLDEICKERGTRSDDGDKIVDKYSGYTIKYIDFDTDEGYDEGGFKILTKSVLLSDDDAWRDEDDASESSQIVASDSVIKDSTANIDSDSLEIRYINNIITSLSDSMGIDIESQRNFIVSNAYHQINTLLGNKEEYKEKRKISGKKGFRMPTYERKLHNYILYFTGLYVLLAIQTAIPPIQTKKTYPNCKKSFIGFPLQSDGDESGLLYIVCIMKRTSGGVKPWASISKTKEEKIINAMKTLYKEYVRNTVEIQQKITDKLAYIVKFGDYEPIPIPIEVNVTKWKTFLPPLLRFDLKPIKNIHDLFRQELNKNIKNGNSKQFQQLNILKSKILFFSLQIQETIQNIVSKEPLLLETLAGIPFLENVCCDTKDNIGCLDYFVKKNDNILKLNTDVSKLSKLYNDVIELAQSAILYSNEHTKLQYPSISKEYAESTIYLAFIKVCKFNKNIPLKESLKRICISNESKFVKTDTLEEKISILKSESRDYNESSLITLMNIVNQENIINISIDKTIVSTKESLEKLLEYFDTFEQDIPQDLNSKLKTLVDTFELKKEPYIENYDSLMDYLMLENKQMTSTINTFITNNGNTKISIKKKLKHFIDTFFEFLPLKGTTLISNDDESMVRTVNYLKNCVYQMANYFPLMIQNKVNFTGYKIPTHWKLSPIHNRDISDIISKSYTYLSRNYGIDDIIPIVNQIPERTKHMIMLMEHTPFMASFLENGERIETLFDAELVLEMYKYYFLYIFNIYIKLSTEHHFDVIDKETTAERIAEAERTLLTERIANLLMDYISIFMKHKEVINFNETTIMEKITQVKDTEKDRKVRTLKNLTIEERGVDNIFKQMKLGRWNKGIQKGLTQYVTKTYDEERMELEQEAIIDLRLNEHTAVVDMNRDIFRLDEYEKKLNEQEILRETNDISGLGDDDELPEGMDGDEGY